MNMKKIDFIFHKDVECTILPLLSVMNFTTQMLNSKIYNKTHQIVPGMSIDIEWMKESIYNYIYEGGIIKMKHNIYSVCYYFDKLMMNAADTTPLVRFFMEYIEHCESIERECQEVKRDIFKKYPEIFSHSFTDEPEIYIIEPLERQTNAPPPDEPTVGLVIDFMEKWRDCTNQKNQMLSAICSYINNLAGRISYTKTQLIKMELVRRGKISGTALDIVIHEMHNQLIELTAEMRRYIIKERTLVYDVTVANMPSYSQETSVGRILYQHYRNCRTLRPYDLPQSVINDCTDKPDLWKVVCKARGICGNLLECPGAKRVVTK